MARPERMKSALAGSSPVDPPENSRQPHDTVSSAETGAQPSPDNAKQKRSYYLYQSTVDDLLNAAEALSATPGAPRGPSDLVNAAIEDWQSKTTWSVAQQIQRRSAVPATKRGPSHEGRESDEPIAFRGNPVDNEAVRRRCAPSSDLAVGPRNGRCADSRHEIATDSGERDTGTCSDDGNQNNCRTYCNHCDQRSLRGLGSAVHE